MKQMDKLHQAREILVGSREHLRTEKNALHNHLRDQRIRAWKEIDLAALTEQLKVLGISTTELQKAMTDYPRQAKEISRHIKLCNNEIGNQLADLIGNKFPGKALVASQNLEKKVHHLEKLKENLFAQTKIFLTADKKLRQSLSIEKLMPLAGHLTKKKHHLFSQGLEIFELVTTQASTENAPRTLSEICRETEKMEPRFQHIEIIGLPRLTEEVVYHYIEIGTETLQQVLMFIKATKGILAADMEQAQKLSHDLSILAKEDTKTLLTEMCQHASSLAKLIAGLYHKQNLKTSMATISDTLEFLNIYHLALKNKIIPALKERATDPQARINPAVIASKMTKSFFAGPKGIIRSMKLMVNSLTGHEAINQVELQLILEKALNTCKIFYGESQEDIKRMQTFIDGLINQFIKPFPYDNIFSLVKQTVVEYGTEVEKFIKQYEIKKEFQPLTPAKVPDSFGKLASILLNKKNAFAKVNK